MTLKSLAKKEREAIYRLFLHQHELSFHEIEQGLGIRSNMVAYHLDSMVKEGLVCKAGQKYRLTEPGERLLPHVPQLTQEVYSPLPVILVAVLHQDRLLMLQRKKRPYLGYWSLPGGRIKVGESIEEAAERIVREKTGIMTTDAQVNHLMHERVQEEGQEKYGFFLLFTQTSAVDPELKRAFPHADWFSLDQLPEPVIPSDQWLITHQLHQSLSVSRNHMAEQHGKLSASRISFR